jgi:hypothetical protein
VGGERVCEEEKGIKGGIFYWKMKPQKKKGWRSKKEGKVRKTGKIEIFAVTAPLNFYSGTTKKKVSFDFGFNVDV